MHALSQQNDFFAVLVVYLASSTMFKLLSFSPTERPNQMK